MASKREVVVATENYLRSKGYNNSTGKYDRVIMGVKSLLGETLLAYGSPEFERAIQQETERMLKKYVKDSAMEYDPIMCMMVPKKANDEYFKKGDKFKQGNSVVEIDYYDKNGNVQYRHNKQAQSATEKGLKNMLERNGYKKVNDKANDSSRVIKQRNGYTLGINGSGTIYLAFPGETENNPHMYLGKENDKNLSDAKILFERFASTKDSASMVYDEIMAMMKPVTAKDKRTTDFSSGDAKTWVVEYDDSLGDYHKKTFTDKTAVEKFIRRGTDVGRAYNLKVNGKPVKNESTWTADAKDQRTVDFSSADAKKIFEYIDRQVTKDMNDYPREIERAKTPDDCERLNNAIRSSLDNAVDEYIQIWNEVGLYAQKRKNEIVDRYGKLMSQAFKKYNELKSRE